MTDRQLKIKMVMRGQGTSINDGAATALEASSKDFSNRIRNLLQELRIDRIAGVAAAVMVAAGAGWWLSAGDAESNATLLTTHGSATIGVQTIAEFAQLGVVMSEAGPTDAAIAEERAESGQPRASTVDMAKPRVAKRPAPERDPFVEYLRSRGTPKKVSSSPAGETPPSSTAHVAAVGTVNAITEVSHVRRSQLTTGMRNKEPVDALVRDVTIADGASDTVYFFTELRDLAGQRVSHKWLRGDKVMATVRFDIGADRWRVYSSKLISAAMTGQWHVRMEDAEGNVLSAQEFLVTNP